MNEINRNSSVCYCRRNKKIKDSSQHYYEEAGKDTHCSNVIYIYIYIYKYLYKYAFIFTNNSESELVNLT
jgi:hypothetical protein